MTSFHTSFGHHVSPYTHGHNHLSTSPSNPQEALLVYRDGHKTKHVLITRTPRGQYSAAGFSPYKAPSLFDLAELYQRNIKGQKKLYKLSTFPTVLTSLGDIEEATDELKHGEDGDFFIASLHGSLLPLKVLPHYDEDDHYTPRAISPPASPPTHRTHYYIPNIGKFNRHLSSMSS